MRVLLNRLSNDNFGIIGILRVYDGSILKAIYSTLEPVFSDGRSKIPSGTHKLVKYYSPKHQTYLWRFNTDQKEWKHAFEIHIGNFRKNSDGCILLGNGFANIDNDKEVDLINSKASFKKFMKITNVLQELKILIIDA